MEYVSVKPWSSKMDGYGSVAKEIVSIVKNSSNFSKSDYEGKGEFYQKYYEFYQTLLASLQLIREVKRGKITDVDIKCINNVTHELEIMKEKGTLNLNAFLIAYVNVITLINPVKNTDAEGIDDELMKIYERYICHYVQEGHEVRSKSKTIIKEMHNKTSDLVPFISPKGVFGINTFLYLYFSGLSPVGISLTPWPVHSGTFINAPQASIMHDIAHYSEYKRLDPSLVDRLKRTYEFIIKTQEERPADKTFGLLVILYYMIHEYPIIGETFDTSDWSNDLTSFIDGDREDFLILMEGNSYYKFDYDTSIIDGLGNKYYDYLIDVDIWNAEQMVDDLKEILLKV